MTTYGARLLGWEKNVGSLAPDNGPTSSLSRAIRSRIIHATEKVVFVMKNGVVYKQGRE